MLSKEQKKVSDELLHQLSLYCSGKQLPFVYRVGGYAGTGKTFMLASMRKELDKINRNAEAAFVTFTGKASSVLRTKLMEQNGIFGQDYIGTIHGLIYKPVTRYNSKIRKWVIIGWKLKKPEELFCDFIFIDEASMVSRDIWKDLLKFQKPIIAVGDHGQLPPVGEGNFSLMHLPDFILTEIHRQALNSPIIKLSQFIRDHGYIPFKIQSKDVLKTSWKTDLCQDIWNNITFDENVVCLCAFNASRANINDMIRKRLGFKNKQPYPGERIVCLKNNRSSGLMNGQIGTVIWYMPEGKGLYRITLQIDGETDPFESICSDKCFGQVEYPMYDKDHNQKQFYKGHMVDYFDYGNCISVHKSQGSEWNRVILFQQRTKRWDDDFYTKWLYTAVTRARKKLLVISDAYI
ncbi:AAA family ATPase [Candidatus Pacearchaeota archaeon]|nr:AAA family ATPase [Candidatus Pacearchaeota archaeon]